MESACPTCDTVFATIVLVFFGSFFTWFFFWVVNEALRGYREAVAKNRMRHRLAKARVIQVQGRGIGYTYRFTWNGQFWHTDSGGLATDTQRLIEDYRLLGIIEARE